MAKGVKTGGRQKGSQNKTTSEVKEMILEALDHAGGVQYLVEKAGSHPQAFLALVGKVLPMQVNGPGANGEHTIDLKINFVSAKK